MFEIAGDEGWVRFVGGSRLDMTLCELGQKTSEFNINDSLALWLSRTSVN
jgi:hypothetical protein